MVGRESFQDKLFNYKEIFDNGGENRDNGRSWFVVIILKSSDKLDF